MAGTYLEIGCCAGSGSGGGSTYFADPVATFASLPGSDPDGTVRLTLDTGVMYVSTSGAWDPIDTEIASVAVTDTNSIDHTITGGVLSSDLKISTDSAQAGYFKATTTVKSGGGAGIHVELQEASGSQTGVLKSADWTTFNNKEPAISAGTAGDYWRGDKTFQALNIAALSGITDGSNASVGDINEVLTGSQATATATGVAATGTWGSVTSVALTAGRWLLWGSVGFTEAGALLSDALSAGISASATGAGIDEFNTTVVATLISGTADVLAQTPHVYVSVSGATTYYLNTKFVYSSGTPQHRGRLRAIRIG